MAPLRTRLPEPARRVGADALRALAALPGLAVLVVAALLARARRRSRRRPARLVWGPEPLVSYAHWSRAMRKAGHESETLMSHVFTRINKREDFDLLFEDLSPPQWAFLIGPYKAFIRSLFRADVFQHPYSGGFLATTPLWRVEAQLIHLAGARVVVQSHGGDAYLSSQINDLSLRHALLSSYPLLARQERHIRARVTYWTEHADCLFGALMMDGLGRWDVLPAGIATLEVQAWRRARPYARGDGRDGRVRVAHAPNHRGFKGTEFIIAAVEQLRAEGLDVELVLLEGLQNEEIRRIFTSEQIDVLVDQIIATGYALNAVEGLAAGIPVIANLEEDHLTGVLRRYSYLDECPILSAGPETITDRLRALVVSPELRERLGRASEAFAAKYHSDEAAAYLYGSIYRRIWNGEDIALIDLFHPLKSAYNRATPRIEHGLERNRLPEQTEEATAAARAR